MPVRDRSIIPTSALTPACHGLNRISLDIAQTPAPQFCAANWLYRASTIAAALYFLATSF